MGVHGFMKSLTDKQQMFCVHFTHLQKPLLIFSVIRVLTRVVFAITQQPYFSYFWVLPGAINTSY